MVRLGSLKYFVEPVLFLTFMTMNMEVSLVQQLIRRKVCLIEQFSDCDGRASQKLVNASSPWIGSYNILLSFVTFFTGLWFGSWADKYGRTKLMLLPSIGSILSTMNFIASSYLMNTKPISLMVSALVIGLTCGTLGVCSTCFGLVSEVTSVERRSTRIAVMEAMVFTGGALGFYIVSFFSRKIGFTGMFSFELIIHVCILLYIMYVLKEPERSPQLALSSTSVASCQHIVSMCRTVTRPREQNFRTVVILLLVSSLALSFGTAAASSLTFTLLTSPPHSWKSDEYSSYHALMLLVQGIPLVVVLPLCLRFCGMRDITSGFLGSLSRMLGLAGLAVSTQSWMLYANVLLFSTSEFAIPSIRSIMSKIVGPDEKSQIFAFMSAQQSLAFVLTSVSLLFPESMTYLFPGYAMAIASCLQIVPLVAFLYLYTIDLSALSTLPSDENNHSTT